MERTRTPSASRVWALNAALIVAASAIYLIAVRPLHANSIGPHIPWWVITAGFAVTEAFVVHLPFRRESESFSLSEIPLVFGLFFTSPGGLIAAQILGAGAALLVRRKQTPVKLVFNIGHMATEAAVAVVIFRAIGDGRFSAPTTVAAFMATLATIVIGVCTVVAAISLTEREFRGDMFRRVLGLGWIVATTNTSLALLGALVIRTEPALAWLLLVPATTMFFAYRAYTSETQKRRGVEMLYGSTRMLQRSLHLEETVRTLLEEAKDIFRAEIAWVTFFPDEMSGQPTRYTLHEGALSTTQPELDPREGLWARVASEGQALLLARPIRNERLRAYYARSGVRDLMIAPLYRDDVVVGTVLVGNRMSDVQTFAPDDLRLFETLVNHAGIALVNARLVSRLEESLERQTELNRLKDDFVAVISHELRTPLTSIKGFVRTLLRPGVVTDEDGRRHSLEIIERQSDRLQAMIEDLLLVSQIEADRVNASWSRVAIDELIHNIVDEFEPRVPAGAISIDIRSPLPRVTSDEDIIQRVISNLVENAVKYSPDRTDVTVRAECDAAGITVFVADGGEGVPEGLHEKIFDRFFQVDGSRTRRVGGSGLGLFISRKLAEAIGGRVWLERSSTSGSTFALWIPLRAALPFAPDDREGQIAAS